MRGKKAARKMNQQAESPEGKKRAAAMKQCDWCGDWYSEDNEKAKDHHENGHCS